MKLSVNPEGDMMNDSTTQHVFFREVNSIILGRFSAADYDSVLEIFPARQDN
jgi:hypothetical protein